MRTRSLVLSVLCFWSVALALGEPAFRAEGQSTTVESFHISAKCIECRAGATLLKYAAKSKPSKVVVAETVKFFCEKLKIEDKHVCKGIVKQYEGLLLDILASEVIDSGYICGVAGLCPQPDYPKWNVTFETPKPPPRPYPEAKREHGSKFVLHVTDVHTDPLYTEGLEVDCGEPICCRPPNPVGRPGSQAGHWGAHTCDAPEILVEQMLQFISDTFGDKLDFGVLTGDLPPHNVWDITRDTAIEAEDFVADVFARHLPGVPMFPAVGNHESVPVNLFFPRKLFESKKWDNGWLYDALANKWAKWLSPEATEQARFAGYYTDKISERLRIVSLNTNMGCNDQNWWLKIPSNETADPDNMLHWLASVMEEAEANNEDVYIIDHISPRESACGSEWWENFYRIVDRYENNILLELSGHTHDDRFRVTYAPTTESKSAHLRPLYHTYFAGSVTPMNHNPSFRVYEIDAETNAVIDFQQWAMNLTQANTDGTPEWFIEYTAADAFGAKDLSPASWADVTQRMLQDKKLFDNYYYFRSKMLVPPSQCDDHCRQGAICATVNPPPGGSNHELCQKKG